MKKSAFFYMIPIVILLIVGKLQAQQSWESVVLEDAFGDDRTAQVDIVQGNGAGNLYVKGVTAGAGIRETFIKVSLNDMDNLAPNQIDFAKVELRLYTCRTNADAAQNQISIYPISNEWGESTLTWTNSRGLSSEGTSVSAIATGQGVRVAAYSGSGQQGQPSDAYNAAQLSKFDISAYAIAQYKAGNKTISVMLKVNNTVNNGDQQLVSKDVTHDGSIPDRELKIPKLIVTQPIIEVDFNAPAIAFAGKEVQFTDKSSLVTSHVWDFGDGTTSTDANPTHTYASSGVYTVTLTINGNSELKMSKTIKVYNISNETLVGGNMEIADKDLWGIVGESTFNQGGAVWGSTAAAEGFGTEGYLYLTEENGISTQYYVWQAVQLLEGNRYIFSFDHIKGTYQKAWGEVYIGSALPGSSDYTDGGSRGTKPMSWNNNVQSDGAFITGQYEYTYDCKADGVYYFVVKVGTNGNGKFLFGLDNLKLTKILNPIADFTNPVFGIENLPVQFTNTSLNATSYSWDFGDGTTSSDMSPTHVYSAKGSYTVSLTVNGSGTDVIAKTIKVYGVNNETVLGGGMELSDRDFWIELGANNLAGGTNDQLVWGDDGGVRSQSYVPAGFGTGGFLTVAEDWQMNSSYKICQALNLNAGSTYTLSFDYAVGTYRRAWFEVYVGTTPPTSADYTDNLLGTSLIPYNPDYSGNGGGTTQHFSHEIKIDNTAVYYVVIKWKCGDTAEGYFNASIDNVNFVKRTESSNKEIDNSYVVFSNGGRICVKSTLPDNKISVYNVSGKLLLSQDMNSYTYESTCLPTGLYLVSVNNKMFKLAIK